MKAPKCFLAGVLAMSLLFGSMSTIAYAADEVPAAPEAGSGAGEEPENAPATEQAPLTSAEGVSVETELPAGTAGDDTQVPQPPERDANVLNTFTVHYNLEGGRLDGLVLDQTFSGDAASYTITLPAEPGRDPDRYEEYIFEGWQDSTTNTIYNAGAAVALKPGDTTFKALWLPQDRAPSTGIILSVTAPHGERVFAGDTLNFTILIQNEMGKERYIRSITDFLSTPVLKDGTTWREGVSPENFVAGKDFNGNAAMLLDKHAMGKITYSYTVAEEDVEQGYILNTVTVTLADDMFPRSFSLMIPVGRLNITVDYPDATVVEYNGEEQPLNIGATADGDFTATPNISYWDAQGNPVTDDAGRPAAPRNAGTYTVRVDSFTLTANGGGNTVPADYTLNNAPPKELTYTLTIVRAPVTVAGNAISSVYGDPVPEPAATVTGRPEAGDAVKYTVGYADGVKPKNAGTYDIVVTAGAEENPNYEVTPEKGALTVLRRPATIRAKSLTKAQGEPGTDLPLEASVTGVVDGDHLEYQLSCDPGDAPGRYPIHITYSEHGANSNYCVTAIDGVLVIKGAPDEPVDEGTDLLANIIDKTSDMEGLENPMPDDFDTTVFYLKDKRETIKSAAANDPAVHNALGELERAFESKAQGVSVNIEDDSDTYAGQVGAAFNASLTDGDKMALTLRIEKNDAATADSVFTVGIDLLYSNGESVQAAADGLAVPVCITLALPESITDPTGLRIYHYHKDAETEVIWPVVFKDTANGRWMARFCVDRFSTFDFVLPEHRAPALDAPGSDGDDAPAGRTGAADANTRQTAAPARTEAAAYHGTIPQTSDDFPLWGAAAVFALALAGLAGLAAMRGIRRRQR